MAEPFIYYDRRAVATTSQQFFYESRGKATNGALTTNMPKDLQFDRNITVKRIVVIPTPAKTVEGAATAEAKALALVTWADTAYFEIQVGTGEVYYLPAVAALNSFGFKGALADQTTPAASLASVVGAFGIEGLELDLDLKVSANTDFKFFLKQSTNTDVGTLQVLLIAERA
jgi:hypothetical protein